MKKVLSFLLLALPIQAYLQTTAKKENAPITVVCKIVDGPPNAMTIFLYERLGLISREVARGQRQEDGSYIITLPSGEPRVYYIGFNDAQTTPVILGKEKNLTLWAHAQYMEKGRTVGSEINRAYENLRKEAERLRAQNEEHCTTSSERPACAATLTLSKLCVKNSRLTTKQKQISLRTGKRITRRYGARLHCWFGLMTFQKMLHRHLL